MAGKYKGSLDAKTAETYRKVKIAMLTGWTFDYISTLGAFDEAAILQIHEAEQKLKTPPPAKKRARR